MVPFGRRCGQTTAVVFLILSVGLAFAFALCLQNWYVLSRYQVYRSSIVDRGVLPCDIANETGIPVFLMNINRENPFCGNTFLPDFAALFRFGALATDQYSRPIVSYQEVRLPLLA